MADVKTAVWIMIGIIVVITIYISGLYIHLRLSLKKAPNQSSTNVRTYACYINIILSASIAINNIVRLITSEEKSAFACQLQGFILALFDKLIGTTIAINSYLTYKGLCDNSNYIENIKIYFIVCNSIGFALSFVFALIFSIRGTYYETVCYVEGGPEKEIPDTIITSILFAIYSFCTIKTILFLVKNIKELALEKDYNKTSFSFHYYRMLVSFLLCSFFYFLTLLIINDSLFFSFEYIDLTFITLCLVVDLFFTLNRTVIKQTLRCFRKDKESKDDYNYDDDEDDNSKQLKSMEYKQ
jgi:hypothetical protein